MVTLSIWMQTQSSIRGHMFLHTHCQGTFKKIYLYGSVLSEGLDPGEQYVDVLCTSCKPEPTACYVLKFGMKIFFVTSR